MSVNVDADRVRAFTNVAAWPATPDLRGWLALRKERGELREFSVPIDADQEVAAVLEHCDDESTVFFDDVVGASFPLVGNTVAKRRQFAEALVCSPADVVGRIGEAVANPRECNEVSVSAAPVASVEEDFDDLLGDLPIPVQHEHDSGKYLTSALLIVRDPRGGSTNLSINRLQVSGPRELGAKLAAGRLKSIFADHEARDENLDVAVCIGVDPLLTLASQAPADPALDDLEVASALYPQPLEVVRLPGHPTPIPARAEVVLLGRLSAGRRAQEGPFGEYGRTYGPGGLAPIIELTRRFRREHPIAQTILSGGNEHFWVGGLPREARLIEALTSAGVQPVGVRLTEGGSCRMHAVVSLKDPRAGATMHAAMTVFASLASVKLIVIVDDDIDIFDDEQVEWAIATRFQADRDLCVVPNTRGGGLDASAGDGGVTAKLAVDATMPQNERERHAVIRSVVRDPARFAYLLSALGAAR